MPPPLASLIFMVFILYAFWTERKKSEDVSAALWIPQIWMFLAGSRYVSQWFNLGAAIDPADIYMEGSPVDRVVFFLLIMAGVIVLVRRRLDWAGVLGQNGWVCSYFLLGAISVLWSDYPLTSLRRLIKATGNVIMALVVLTERRPYDAAGVVLRRLAFLLLPLSVLFIKYYPALGRAYHPGSWETMYIGVSTQKNGLGALCLLSGIYFCWALLQRRHGRPEPAAKLRTPFDIVFLCMIAWLLYKANSATALVCLVLAVGIFMVSRSSSFSRNPRSILVLGVGAACVFGILNLALDLSGLVVGLLGRDETLTTRVPMWQSLREMAGNPLVGVGYESFWLGERLQAIWADYGKLNQAHNGYLEAYLNLGVIGLALIVGSMLSGLLRVWRQLPIDYSAAVRRLCFIVTIAVYNYTEATFHGVSNLWLLFLLGVLDVRGPEAGGPQMPSIHRSSVAGEEPAQAPRPATLHARTRSGGATLT